MIRRELWVPLAVAILTLTFLLVSWLVRLSRGNPWLMRRKLRLGAILLGLTWAAAGCTPDPTSPESDPRGTCYYPAPRDHVTFDLRFYSDHGLVLDLAQGSALTGTIEGHTANAYAFLLLDSGSREIQRGDVQPLDGAFDAAFEPFRLEIKPDRLPAAATLRICKGPAGTIDTAAAVYEWPLIIIPAGR